MAGKIGERFFEGWKATQAGRAKEALQDAERGLKNGISDVRRKVVEDPWYGKEVTRPVPGENKPGTINSYRHDASTHYDMSVNTNNSVDNSKTFNAPVNYNGDYRVAGEKDIHGNGGKPEPEKAKGMDIHGNGGEAKPVDSPYQAEGLPNDNTAGVGLDRPADRPGDFFSYMQDRCGSDVGEGRGRDHSRDQSQEP